MEKKKNRIDIFRIDEESIIDRSILEQADFGRASIEEKESMVNDRKSISYWKDAMRRFCSNPISMASLAIFLMIVVFAFVGPEFIQYDYKDQYRKAAKLAPMEHSEEEQTAMEILKQADLIYYTSLLPGSVTSLKPGSYYFNYKGTDYGFTLEEKASKSILMFDADAENPLSLGKEKAYKEGSFQEIEIIEYQKGIPEGGQEIVMMGDISPHVFGTDSQGRDLMARCMYGSRVSLIIGIVAALIVLVIGAVYGSVSGLLGGKIDFVMMRIIDLIISIPSVLMVLLLQVVISEPLQAWFDSSENGFVKSLSDLGVGIVSIFITFALLYWVSMARIIRGQVLQLKEQEYVTAAKALGAGNGRIIKRHLLPNCIGQLVVATCLQIPSAIFMESFLSYLGMGVSAPMASLGSLCSDAIDTITQYPYRMIFPSVILTVMVLSLNLLGDGLRDALDPRLKK